MEDKGAPESFGEVCSIAEISSGSRKEVRVFIVFGPSIEPCSPNICIPRVFDFAVFRSTIYHCAE
jgi:hypothetical protein